MQAQAADASAVLSAVRMRAIGPCADQLSHAEIDPATIVDDVPVENMLPGRIAARCPMRSRCRRHVLRLSDFSRLGEWHDWPTRAQ